MVGRAGSAVRDNEVAPRDGIYIAGEVLITWMLGAAHLAGWLAGCW